MRPAIFLVLCASPRALAFPSHLPLQSGGTKRQSGHRTKCFNIYGWAMHFCRLSSFSMAFWNSGEEERKKAGRRNWTAEFTSQLSSLLNCTSWIMNFWQSFVEDSEKLLPRVCNISISSFQVEELCFTSLAVHLHFTLLQVPACRARTVHP